MTRLARNPDRPGAAARRATPLLLLFCLACADPPQDARPSIVLVVFDTVRRDAVSAYGEVEGTTPNLDALARDGLRYRFAFAPTPWTVPSHATLFSGLPQYRHGVGLRGRLQLPDELVTLAERLQLAGYETAGFSENQLVGAEFNLDQGFSHYAYESPRETIENRKKHLLGEEPAEFDIVEQISAWASTRDRGSPFFVFVNLLDAHDPYTVRERNPFVPDGVDAERARSVLAAIGGPGGIAERLGICDRIPPREDIEILRGLYLGEVAVSDRKLAEIRSVLIAANASRDLVTVVTADHGEHLGERRLLGHEFSVRNALLNVPLVVHGLTGAEPGVFDQRVELADLAPSILGWAGVEVPEGLPGRALPVTAETTEERSIVGAYFDEPLVSDGVLPNGNEITLRGSMKRRQGCSARDRVFGASMALVRYPHKLIWFEEGHPSELYDLSWDPAERSDQAEFQPEVVASLEERLVTIRRRFEAAESSETPASVLPPEAVEALRSMGYLE